MASPTWLTHAECGNHGRAAPLKSATQKLFAGPKSSIKSALIRIVDSVQSCLAAPFRSSIRLIRFC